MKFKRRKTVDALLSDTLPDNEKVVDAVNRMFEEDAVSRHLFILRTRAGVSQAEMARRLNVSQSVVSKMENNGNYLKFNDVIRYMHALDFSAEMTFIQEGRAVDFLRSYFSRITRMMDMFREMAGDDPDINAGILTAFGDFSKSMMDNVLPKFEKITASRLSGLEFSITPAPEETPARDAPAQRRREKTRKRNAAERLPA